MWLQHLKLMLVTELPVGAQMAPSRHYLAASLALVLAATLPTLQAQDAQEPVSRILFK
jgi:hypothetical protein